MSKKHSYSISGLDKFINKTVSFIFYYRLVVVFLSLIILGFISWRVFRASLPIDEIRNVVAVITGGCVVIGIFYSLLNYENSLLKSRNDTQTFKEVLTYNAAAKMHEKSMLENSRIVREFHTRNKQLIMQGKLDQVEALMLEVPENRTSYLALFNYFELISPGVEKEILDEDFMKEFFKTIFNNFYTFYGTFIVHTRNERLTPTIFVHFSTLAERWFKSN